MASKVMTGASEPAVRNVALPQHAATYTVIPNGLAIDEARKQLATYGFKVVKEEYVLGGKDEQGNHQIAMGRYVCEMPGAPMEFKMVLLWVNSYDKSTRFKVAIGVHLMDAGVDIIKGEGSSFRRKHTGKADEEVIASLDEKLSAHATLFNEIMDDKVLMEGVDMNSDRSGFFLGKGFLEWKLLSGEQMQSVRRFMDKPVYQPQCNNAWCFYVRMLMGCSKEHPRSYVETFRALHSKIMYYVTTGFPNLSDIKIDVPLMDKVHSNVPAAVVEEQLKINAEDSEKVAPIEVLPNQISLFEEVIGETITVEKELTGNPAEVVERKVIFDLGEDGPVRVEVETIVPVEPVKELPQEVKVKPKIVSEIFSIASALFQNGYDITFKGEIMAAYGEVYGHGEADPDLFCAFLKAHPSIVKYKKVEQPKETHDERSNRLLDAIKDAHKVETPAEVGEAYAKAQEMYGETIAKLTDNDRTLLEDIESGKVAVIEVADEPLFDSEEELKAVVDEVVDISAPALVIPQVEWELIDTSKGMVGQPTLYDYRIIEGKMHRKLKRPVIVVDEELDNPDFFAAPVKEAGKIVEIEIPTAEIPSIDVPIIPTVNPTSPSNVSPFL